MGLGHSVSLSSDGSVLAIGIPGYNSLVEEVVRVYYNLNGNWEQIGEDINGNEAPDDFGRAISLNSDGSIIVIGAPYYNAYSGQVKVYEKINESWVQIGNDINGESAEDWFGGAVSINSDGSIIAVGAVGDDGNGFNTGHARVFENQGGTWVQIGQDLDGDEWYYTFGESVDLNADGSIVAVGCAYDSGYVRVYEYHNNNWVQIGTDIHGESSGDYFGHAISINSNGSIISIGGCQNDGNTGHVRIFENQDGNWVQIGEDIDGEEPNGKFGYSVSINSDGSAIAVGALQGGAGGQVRVFENQENNWAPIGEVIDCDSAGARFGKSVSISGCGSIVAIGAPCYNENAGQVKVFARTSNVKQVSSNNEIKLFPNPINEYFKILPGKAEIKNIKIFNLKGNTVYSSSVYEAGQQIVLPGLNKGVYIIYIQTSEQFISKRIIKN